MVSRLERKLSLYPLRSDGVISDLHKMKPESKQPNSARRRATEAHRRKRRGAALG